MHRQVLASFVYILEIAAVIGFLVTGPAWSLILAGAVIIAVGSMFFFGLSYAGKRLCDQIESRKLDIHDVSTSSPQEESTVSSTFDLNA